MSGRRLAALLLPALLLPACMTPPDASHPPAPPGPPPATVPVLSVHATVEAEVHALVNRHRAGVGLPPLAYDERVADVARRHSEAMATSRRPFSHEGFDERATAVTRFLPLRSMAENVAYDSRSAVAAETVGGWIRSPVHLRNIEGPYDVTGVGVARSGTGAYYFTQLFVGTR
jgi:uncharacterized protein YkwD